MTKDESRKVMMDESREVMMDESSEVMVDKIREVMMDESREVIPDNGRQAAAMIQTFSAQYSTCLQKLVDHYCFQQAPALAQLQQPSSSSP